MSGLTTKTSVSKYGDEWRVLYVWPFAGLSEQRYESWGQAIAAACDLEKQRPFAP